MNALSIFRGPPSRRPVSAGFPRSALCIVFAALCLVPAHPAAAQNAKPTDYQVKAAYLSRLGRFVESWGGRNKPSPEQTFSICTLGQDPFGSALNAAIGGENLEGAPIVAKRLERAQDATGCQVLFISSSEESQLASILSALAGAPVLTVSDMSDFVKRGGIVQFVLDANRVRFDINVAAAGRAGLTLSSELLKIARLVRRTP